MERHDLDALVYTGHELTQDLLDQLLDFVQKAGENRAAAQCAFNECDFLAGAICALFAFGQADKIPARWIFAPMTGKAVFDALQSSFEEKLDEFERRISDLENNDDE